MSLDFRVFDCLTRRFGGTIDLLDWSFTEEEQGVSTMTGALKPTPFIRASFVPEKHGLAVVDDDQVVWAGPLIARKWKRRQKTLSVEMEGMEAFFYDRVRSPALKDYIKKDVEQTTLWNDLISAALTGAPATGIPSMLRIVPAPTGNKHTLTFRSLSNYGKVFDNLQNRIRGLQWWMSYRISDNRRFIEYIINVGRRGQALRPIVATYDDEGGNILDQDWDESAAGGASAVYTFGDGTPPAVQWGYNEDPAVGKGQRIRREIAINRSGTTQVATLNARARDERTYRDQRTSSLPITLPADQPDYRSYTVGDRVRLAYQDEWMSIDLPGARIIDRAVSGKGSEATTVKMTLDATDYEAPREPEEAEVSGG